MSFNIALTGLNAVTQQLDTISNNIANSGTVGFKSSRTEFGSVYADTKGMGVEVTGTTQSISQGGSLVSTNRALTWPSPAAASSWSRAATVTPSTPAPACSARTTPTS